jgi:hypothetical protein
VICTSCDHDIREHDEYGCQNWWPYADPQHCPCSVSREAVQDSWEVLERETIMEQRIADMERGMYDDVSY